MKKLIYLLLLISGGLSAQVVIPKSTTTFSNVNAVGSMTVGGSINNINLKRSNNIYTLGDSQTEGGDYQAQLITRLGNAWDYVDFGVGGERTDDMLGRITGLTKGDAKYAIVWGGINDVIADYSAATIQANLQGIFTALKSASFTVISINITPFKGYASWTAGRQTILDNVNTWISATATNVDYKLDLYSQLEDPGNADYLLPAYDSGDGLHLSAGGYTVVGNYVYNNVTFTALTTPVELRLGREISLEQELSPSSSPVFRKLMLSEGLWIDNTPNSTNYILKPSSVTSVLFNTQNSLFFRVNDVTIGSYNSTTFNTNVYLNINNPSSDNKIFFYRTSGKTHSIQHGTTSIYLYNNTDGKIAWRSFNNNSFSVGNEVALSTTATDGFLYIPSCAGLPTGVPTAITGKIPIVVDSTNNKMYIYSGGAWVALN